uniref:Uncharacterized protein n=1 Tax=Amphilophus citrinellus TaxID=61819 RepID=A0A3Q0QYD8_AMPCI
LVSWLHGEMTSSFEQLEIQQKPRDHDITPNRKTTFKDAAAVHKAPNLDPPVALVSFLPLNKQPARLFDLQTHWTSPSSSPGELWVISLVFEYVEAAVCEGISVMMSA